MTNRTSGWSGSAWCSSPMGAARRALRMSQGTGSGAPAHRALFTAPWGECAAPHQLCTDAKRMAADFDMASWNSRSILMYEPAQKPVAHTSSPLMCAKDSGCLTNVALHGNCGSSPSNFERCPDWDCWCYSQRAPKDCALKVMKYIIHRSAEQQKVIFPKAPTGLATIIKSGFGSRLEDLSWGLKLGKHLPYAVVFP